MTVRIVALAKIAALGLTAANLILIADLAFHPHGLALLSAQGWKDLALAQWALLLLAEAAMLAIAESAFDEHAAPFLRRVLPAPSEIER